MKPSLRFGALLVLILVAGVFVNAWSYLGEAHVERKGLKDFPQNIGAWQKTGNDQILDDETLKVLRASGGSEPPLATVYFVAAGPSLHPVGRGRQRTPYLGTGPQAPGEERP